MAFFILLLDVERFKLVMSVLVESSSFDTNSMVEHRRVREKEAHIITNTNI